MINLKKYLNTYVFTTTVGRIVHMRLVPPNLLLPHPQLIKINDSKGVNNSILELTLSCFSASSLLNKIACYRERKGERERDW